MENAGSRFQKGFVDEPLLERLRVCATDSLSDDEVKQRCQLLFRQWASAYKSTPGMEKIVALQKQLPKRKKPVTQQQSKVLRETEPNPNDNPFGNVDDDQGRSSPAVTSSAREYFAPTSSSAPLGGFLSSSQPSKTAKPDKSSKKTKHKAFSLEREKPQILQTIASSSIASTNLMNALKLIDREHKRVSEDSEAINRFETCKQLRKQILRYIQHIESEQWLGSLIHANDALIDALMAYEILDKSVEDDSDSDGLEWSDSESASGPQPTRPETGDIDQGVSSLSIGKKPFHPTMVLNGQGTPERDDDSASDQEADEDNPFADSNVVHTPKDERPGMTWREV